MNIQVRTASTADATSACDVLRRSILECCAEDHRNDAAVLAAWLGNKTPANVQDWFKCATHHCLIALDDERVQGVAILTRAGKIVLFYVAPEARFHGVGTALLQAMEAAARKWGLRSLCVASTLTAASFYERNGFVVGDPKTSAFGTPAVSFSKQLSPGGCRCGG